MKLAKQAYVLTRSSFWIGLYKIRRPIFHCFLSRQKNWYKRKFDCKKHFFRQLQIQAFSIQLYLWTKEKSNHFCMWQFILKTFSTCCQYYSLLYIFICSNLCLYKWSQHQMMLLRVFSWKRKSWKRPRIKFIQIKLSVTQIIYIDDLLFKKLNATYTIFHTSYNKYYLKLCRPSLKIFLFLFLYEQDVLILIFLGYHLTNNYFTAHSFSSQLVITTKCIIFSYV